MSTFRVLYTRLPHGAYGTFPATWNTFVDTSHLPIADRLHGCRVKIEVRMRIVISTYRDALTLPARALWRPLWSHFPAILGTLPNYLTVFDDKRHTHLVPVRGKVE